jgi:hypothetical protein
MQIIGVKHVVKLTLLPDLVTLVALAAAGSPWLLALLGLLGVGAPYEQIAGRHG